MIVIAVADTTKILDEIEVTNTREDHVRGHQEETGKETTTDVIEKGTTEGEKMTITETVAETISNEKLLPSLPK